MPFLWQIPNPPLNKLALARMSQHFAKPVDLMPEAWFIGGQINYFSWLAEDPPDTLEPRVLIDAMKEIAGGITAFPKTYVDTWKAWFKYLLPYAIANADKGSGSMYRSVLLSTLTAFVSVYPQEIHEEYKGFRDDVIYSLGTRIFPHISSLNELDFSEVSTLLNLLPGEHPTIFDDIRLPMLFGLKYLETSEIEDWVKSIIGIQNYAWYFALIIWWLIYNKFLNLAQH